jgi:hypothetical protein
MVTNENHLQLITKLVGLVVQMKVRGFGRTDECSIGHRRVSHSLGQEFSESEGSFLELHAIDQANRNVQQCVHPSLLT